MTTEESTAGNTGILDIGGDGGVPAPASPPPAPEAETPLTAEAILALDDLELIELPIPEWGRTVWIKTMTGKERDKYEEGLVRTRGRGRNQTREMAIGNARAQLAVRVVCDKDGNRIFNDSHADALGNKSAAALQRIWDVAADKSRISPDDLDEMLGNSETDQTEPSLSS